MKCSVCDKEIDKSANENFIVCDECDLQIKKKIEGNKNKVYNKKEKKNNKKIIIISIILLIISVFWGFIVGLKDSGISNAEFWVIITLVGFVAFVILLLAFVIVMELKNSSKNRLDLKNNQNVEVSKNLNDCLLIKCKVCGNKISKNASTCPHCGEPVENIKSSSKNSTKVNNTSVYQIVLGIFLTIIGFSMMFGYSGKSNSEFSLIKSETYRKA